MDNFTAERTIGGVLAGLGLAALCVLAWGARRVMLLERALDVGDFVVLGVFAAFGSFCVGMGWYLFRIPPSAIPSSPEERAAPDPGPPAARVTLSHACAAVGVVLLILCVVVPARWHPVVLLFVGLAFLAVSHALTPCVERIELLRRARASERQL